MDERICDGVYYARSFKLLEKYFYNPHLLETGLIEKVKKSGQSKKAQTEAV